MESWKKQWLKFVVGTTINAGVYITYRLYVHHQKKKEEKEQADNVEKLNMNNTEAVKNSSLKIVKQSPKGSLEEQLIDIKNNNRKDHQPKLKIQDKKSDK